MPESDWGKYFRDLLEFEPALVWGDAIGHCPEFPFTFEVTDPSRLIMKPMPYPRHQRQWIREYIASQIRMGVMREVKKGEESDPQFVTNVVLVPDGQSQQDFRFCGNFVQPNTRIQPPAHPLIDCQSALDNLQGSTVLSGIDIK